MKRPSISTEPSVRGFVTIATVLMLLAVAAAAALIVMSLLSVSIDRTSAWQSYSRARGLSDGCAETARARLWEDPGYAGGESFTFGTGSCSILPVIAASGSYDVRAEGMSGRSLTRTLATYELRIDASGSVLSLIQRRWQQVEEF